MSLTRDIARHDRAQVKRHSALDKALDEQLRYTRDQYKWLDTRFAWSTAASFLLVYFMSVNTVSPVRFGSYDGPFWEYVIAVVFGSGFFLLSLMQAAVGMSVSFSPWSRKNRRAISCTSFMWMRNAADHQTAATFVSEIMSLDETAVREAKAQEIWRLSGRNEQKQGMLMWARISTVGLGLCAFMFAIAVLPISGFLKLDLFR